ncbi:aldo/keto reductase [Streptomyces sp. ITFR-16]|uniref:aldo/keto reductase n=1 Tax=Streptomyces sp. ITFR-16 TaxID=3075198 RepID=UPI0028896ADB|nr:aldo/keto reductase [Streptomyces sp. ITFR-16]WNI24297.1 aldo/keto reductase [Streptomyces sp. ITFR-16]
MKYRTIGTDPATRREVSALALGAMLFGSVTDEKTSFAILDHFVEAGGTFIDTSDNYAYWVDGGLGGQSERLLGKWRRSRGIGDEIVIATKLGAEPLAPGTGFVDNPEGLSAKAVHAAVERSRERLGVEKIDLLYAHIEDRTVPLGETVEAFGELVQQGTVGLLGASNHAIWRIERARALARAAGLPGYEVLQYQHSHLRPRYDIPTPLFEDGSLGHAGPELLSYLRAEQDLTLVAYSPLLAGAYTRRDKPLPADYDHPGTPSRLAVLHEITAETGATTNQVVLAWQLSSPFPIIPLAGASSLSQLKENLAAVDLELTEEQRGRLDGAY